jgi:hypothetical protein
MHPRITNPQRRDASPQYCVLVGMGGGGVIYFNQLSENLCCTNGQGIKAQERLYYEGIMLAGEPA